MLTAEVFSSDIPVGNALFEAPGIPATSAPSDGRGFWGLAAWSGGGVGTYAPGTPFLDQEGDNVGYLSISATQSGGSAFYQDTTLIQEGTYSLTVGVAHEPGAEPTTEPFRINFEAAGFGSSTNLLDENDYEVGSFNNTDLTSVNATLTIPSGSPEIGRYLRPVLLFSGQDAGSNPSAPGAKYNLNNVQMEFTPPGGTPSPVVVGAHTFDPQPWRRPAGSGGNSGEYNPLAPVFGNQVGDQLGFVSLRDFSGSWGALYQDVTTIAPGTYTMTVGVAHEPGYEPTAAPLSLNFEAVGGGLPTSLLSENDFTVDSVNSTEFTDLSVNLTVPAGSEDIGRDLRLVLVASGQEAGTDPLDPRATYLFDNVRLEFTPVPEPSSAAFVLISLATVFCRRTQKSFQ